MSHSIERLWRDSILDKREPADAWKSIFELLKACALQSTSPVELHKQTIPADRLLSESAWSLWNAYEAVARRTSVRLKEWCAKSSASGKALLILDALSMNELPLILGGAKKHGVEPAAIDVMGAEIPSDTDAFAQALGVTARASFANDKAPAGVALFGERPYTDVINAPFADCCGLIPPEKNLLIWHSWLDDMIHLYRKTPDQIHNSAVKTFQSDDFWQFIDCLRQGRELVITGDHGYGNCRLFSSEETDPSNTEAFRKVFSASRYVPAKEPWTHSFMPPCVVSTKDHHVIMGQKKWKVQGGFPALCHGGLTLLEVAVPFIEFAALQ
jgi:hypothetical protein